MESTFFVGIDGSAPSVAALRWAVDRANIRTPIVLVHIIDVESATGPDEAQRIGASVLSRAASIARRCNPSLSVTTVMRNGRPASVLASLGQPADLIAVGTHKTGFVRGRVFGSCGVIVAAASLSSVAVVPDATLRGRRGVVVGVDPSGQFVPSVARGVAECLRGREDLILVHARPACRCASSDGDCRECRAAVTLLTKAREQARRLAPSLTIRTRPVWGRPAERLLDASGAASLLVLGDANHPAHELSRCGTVMHETLLNLNAPVLIVRGTTERPDRDL